ncbi:hypothetical protein [Staphylococcus epidermidis]|uniref:hypothetical protein n=1 Tax=Staphylococcus epidermidis TaxID=1282 RepID=UPI0013868770|nr:hypothetical protein [Staphylococcus epidermidis]
MEQLDKNQTLLDQQQRLSLNDQNSIKMLESELEEKKKKKKLSGIMYSREKNNYILK